MIDSADLLNFVTKFEDFEKGTKAGKINVVTGIEGLSQIGEDIDMIDSVSRPNTNSVGL